MGYTEGTWRLKALLFIVIIMSLMYSAQAMFMNIETEFEGEGWQYDEYNISNESLSQTEVAEAGGDIFSTLGFIFAVATFTAPEGLPTWCVFILTFFAISLWITLAYIVYTFLYEIVKGLPFT